MTTQPNDLDVLQVEMDLVDDIQVRIAQSAALTRLLAAAVSSGGLDEIADADAGFVAMLAGSLSAEATEKLAELHRICRSALDQPTEA